MVSNLRFPGQIVKEEFLLPFTLDMCVFLCVDGAFYSVSHYLIRPTVGRDPTGFFISKISTLDIGKSVRQDSYRTYSSRVLSLDIGKPIRRDSNRVLVARGLKPRI